MLSPMTPSRLAVLLAGLALVAPAGAEPEARAAASDPEAVEAPEAVPPRVDLEQLLQLPSGLDYSVEKRGGLTPGEWRSRFESVRRQLAATRAELVRAQDELSEVAQGADAWNVGPSLPGGVSAPEASEAPLDFRLRQEIRGLKAEVDRLERALLNLQVEANLAGVPEAWRN